MNNSTPLPPDTSHDDVRQQRRQTQRTTSAENFIPLRKADLRALLLKDPILTERQREQFQQFCQLLEAAIHYEYYARLEVLKDAYAPFDPDADVKRQATPTAKDREQLAKEYFAALNDLLDRANFQHLSHEQLSAALDQVSRFGVNMDVDFSIFQQLEIYSRGNRKVIRNLPGLWNRWRKKTSEVPIYQRLVVLFRLQPNPLEPNSRHEQTIFVKIFKDIPKSDIDMLLPGTRIQMTWVDQSKIILPTISGLAFALYKLLNGALLIAFAGVYGLLSVLGIVGGTLGYGIKSFYSYLNTKDKYYLNLTRNLYYQNLDTNAGVMFRLLDEAEEQEFREVMIAYFLLWKHAQREGWSVEQLDLAAEEFILENTGEQVDFEIGDALEKLAAMKLVAPAANGKWKPIDLQPAIASLDATWDALFSAEPIRTRSSVPHFFRPAPLDPSADNDDWGPVL